MARNRVAPAPAALHDKSLEAPEVTDKATGSDARIWLIVGVTCATEVGYVAWLPNRCTEAVQSGCDMLHRPLQKTLINMIPVIVATQVAREVLRRIYVPPPSPPMPEGEKAAKRVRAATEAASSAVTVNNLLGLVNAISVGVPGAVLVVQFWPAEV